ncbi:hypothetical protein ACOMHN_064614 [Nucella lapillus]
MSLSMDSLQSDSSRKPFHGLLPVSDNELESLLRKKVKESMSKLSEPADKSQKDKHLQDDENLEQDRPHFIQRHPDCHNPRREEDYEESDTSKRQESTCLAAILDMSLSMDSIHMDNARRNLVQDLSETEVDFESLLKGKIIKGPFGERPDSLTAESERLQKRTSHERGFPRAQVSGRCAITHCSRQKVSKMGKRKVPLHEACKGETYAHKLSCVPCACNRSPTLQGRDWHPKCHWYDTWIKEKMLLRVAALKVLTLDDLLRIHRNCRPGEIGVATEFDLIAVR